LILPCVRSSVAMIAIFQVRHRDIRRTSHDFLPFGCGSGRRNPFVSARLWPSPARPRRSRAPAPLPGQP
jgi:hypothetical protein